VYFARDSTSDEIVGVFKPRDEEVGGPNHAHHVVGALKIGDGSPQKEGMKIGDTIYKEVAAFEVDHKHFANVPSTKLYRIADKFGSLQEFVKGSIGSSEDFGSDKFNTRDVHAIGLLDLRLFNCDRHLGNILVTNGDSSDEKRLVPIDHGFTLPDMNHLSDGWFEWSSWKQCKTPFDSETLEYVQSLDSLSDAVHLARMNIRNESIMTYVICNQIVKSMAVNYHKTLKEIVDLFERKSFDGTPSVLEELVAEALSNSPLSGVEYDWEHPSDQLLSFFRAIDQSLQARIG